MRRWPVSAAIVVLIVLARAAAQERRTLDIYSIDVEGGQATLFVAPGGESMLVDTGSPGARDADRIAAAAREAGVRQIDYLVITHYDGDHVGGVRDLAERLPIRNFVDHGARTQPFGASTPTADALAATDRLDRQYAEVRASGRHIEVKPGDRVPIRGLDVQVVSSKGAVLTAPMRGAGAVNPLCSQFSKHPTDTSENIFSVGLMIGAFDRFRFLDLGDLTWNTEHDLVCPNNLLGTVDVYLTTHHGLARSGPPALVHAVRPRVVIVNNGSKKGNSSETWDTLKRAPRLEDIWQLHYAVARPAQPRFEEIDAPGGDAQNTREPLIANVGDPAPDHTPAFLLHLVVQPDGGFSVTNTRNGVTKVYARSSGR